jgi:hypothetical protein
MTATDDEFAVTPLPEDVARFVREHGRNPRAVGSRPGCARSS